MALGEGDTISWQLSEPAKGLFLFAEADGIFLKSGSFNVVDIDTLSQNCIPQNRLGRLLPTLVPQLLELGLAYIEQNSVRISYDDFVTIEDHDIDAFESIVPWSPFLVDLKTDKSGVLGRGNFRYELRFFWGRQQVHLERRGCFVKRRAQIFRLDRQSYSLWEEVEKFNSLSQTEKESSDALIRFANIKDLSEGVGAKIDEFIHNFRILVSPSIGLDIIVEENNRISLSPKFDIPSISEDSIRNTFKAADDPTDLSIQSSDGSWIKIVFNEEQKEVLRRMQKVRNLGGKDRADVLRNPQKVFDGVAGALEFGPRVKDIGDFPFISQPFIKISWPGEEGPFGGPESGTEPPERRVFKVGIKCSYHDGSAEDVIFKTREELLSFQNKVKTALQKGEGTVDLNGKTLVIDRDFAKSIEAVVDRVTKKPKDPEQSSKSQRLYLLIYENEEAREYVEDRELKTPTLFNENDFFLPNELIDQTCLKKHQKEGVKWLQTNYLLRRSGCLLADDMGLGKTLQVLIFLAWLIERGDISPEGTDIQGYPWNPILIVTPVMLLENETWINDMKKFFKFDGEMFRPYITLHGNRIREFKREGAVGRETEQGTALLDTEKLRNYRVILTNYETIVNYQFSFASMKPSWSVIVTDEAQEYKTPKTKISHALKSLVSNFRIACTGTPVETQLMDVWNLFDFLQPGVLLGSAKEFTENFARPVAENPDNCKAVLDSLREKLQFGKKDSAYVLRRDKVNELDGLPKKHEHAVDCLLSPEQREMHIDFVNRGRAGGEDNHPLKMIQQLMYLYQHPALIPQYNPFSKANFQEAFSRCPKLEKLMEILKDIRSRKEKALIFTRSLYMQQLLADAISHTFGINPDIINGATPRKGSTIMSNNTRNGMLKRFRESKDFNVIILSPDVAGIGLTLVEANHVIHYGRWWNPAKESQASDRVYRIGQTKDVNVYYLIARDPQGAFKTFDEKLDALIKRRRKIADDFLAPMPTEVDMGKEIYKDIFEEESIPSGKAHNITIEDVRKIPWDRFEALVHNPTKLTGKSHFM